MGDYFQSLPERYRNQWLNEGIGEKADEVAETARTSLRTRLSREPAKYVEDAVRRGCGAQAQHFDKAMREDMEKHRSQWNVWCRILTMRREEQQAAQPRAAAQAGP